MLHHSEVKPSQGNYGQQKWRKSPPNYGEDREADGHSAEKHLNDLEQHINVRHRSNGLLETKPHSGQDLVKYVGISEQPGQLDR
jgi:hypothetical protein